MTFEEKFAGCIVNQTPPQFRRSTMDNRRTERPVRSGIGLLPRDLKLVVLQDFWSLSMWNGGNHSFLLSSKPV